MAEKFNFSTKSKNYWSVLHVQEQFNLFRFQFKKKLEDRSCKVLKGNFWSGLKFLWHCYSCELIDKFWQTVRTAENASHLLLICLLLFLNSRNFKILKIWLLNDNQFIIWKCLGLNLETLKQLNFQAIKIKFSVIITRNFVFIHSFAIVHLFHDLSDILKL